MTTEEIDEIAKKHEFPLQLLKAINENTGGGFILFYIDGEQNQNFYTQTDNSTCRRALLDFSGSVIEKLREMDDEQLDHALMMAFSPEFFADLDEDYENGFEGNYGDEDEDED